MRGFALGSLTLVALYAVLNNKNSLTAASTGGGVVTTTLRKMISPYVAAIPQRKSAIPK